MMVLGKLKRAVEVLREARLARLVSHVPPNEYIFRHMRRVADEAVTKLRTRGLDSYLENYPPVGQIKILEDWFYDRVSGEMHLAYSNSLFAPGCLRLRPGKSKRGLIVFLPGYWAGADDVFGDGHHPQNMTGIGDALGMGMACWDWPLQGMRRDGCLYRGLRSVCSGEREYSRVFPALHTSLWREEVAELQFALGQIWRQMAPEQPIHVVGWSMGGCFAYVAPLLGTDIATTIAAGSCASVKDLLAEGKTRLHGYFFYPLNGLAYFDLEDVVGELLRRGHRLQIIYGEHDAGCLESTRRSLTERASELGHLLCIEVLPAHGHVFSPAIKGRVIELLSAYNSKTC